REGSSLNAPGRTLSLGPPLGTPLVAPRAAVPKKIRLVANGALAPPGAIRQTWFIRRIGVPKS
ncbi:MAG TPA: hypothetical protein VFJ20_11925, partial [Gemmatimonadaceae bacterium]|nr:hypothetical protein [Gemmatimonadaceae bacterium]